LSYTAQIFVICRDSKGIFEFFSDRPVSCASCLRCAKPVYKRSRSIEGPHGSDRYSFRIASLDTHEDYRTLDFRKHITFPSLHLMSGKLSLRTKQLNESCFYCSVPGCNGARSMASNPCSLRASLLGKCEATRDIPTACGQKSAICNRVRPVGRRNRAALSVFDTLLPQSYQSLVPRNQMLWLY
jgi:hypothetical protein